MYVSVSGGSDATNTFITIDHIIATANTAGALPYVMTPCLRRLWHAVRECIEFVPSCCMPLVHCRTALTCIQKTVMSCFVFRLRMAGTAIGPSPACVV